MYGGWENGPILEKLGDWTEIDGLDAPGKQRTSVALPSSACLRVRTRSAASRPDEQTDRSELNPQLASIETVPELDRPRSDSISTAATDLSQDADSPFSYQVWYEFHRLRYTIRIVRTATSAPAPIPLSRSSTATKRRSVVNILEGPRELEDFDVLSEGRSETASRVSRVSTNRSSTFSETVTALPSCDSVQLKMRRSLRGGWHVRITTPGGQHTRFRASPDCKKLGAWKQRSYNWSEAGTGRLIARSGQEPALPLETLRGKPFMRFTSNDNDSDEESVQQEWQDDLVACWTAWLWADQVLPSVNAGSSMKSSKSPQGHGSSMIERPDMWLILTSGFSCSSAAILASQKSDKLNENEAWRILRNLRNRGNEYKTALHRPRAG
jgi:hypothetical protein